MSRVRGAVLVLALWLVALPAWAAPSGHSVAAVGLTVSDMERALDFYTRVLPFEREFDTEVTGPDYERLEGVFGLRMRVVALKLGSEKLILTQYLVPEGAAFPADSRSNDRWFQHVAIVVANMDRAYAQLRQNHVRYASTGPQTLPRWNRAAGGIRAFYFRDPDGHYLELINFPPGKGDPRWQQSTGRLFLGIDHSAIVVAHTDRSVAFYRDLLGFRIAGTSENYGDEQAHLNNVRGAHLKITTLRSQSGPGVELLEYLAPRDGRAIPPDSKPNDLIFWNVVVSGPTTLVTGRLGVAAVTTPGRELGFSHAAIVRDPDGHALELVEQ